MKEKIGKHNAKILNNESKITKNKPSCNCRVKTNCPIPGECNQSDVMYQVEVVAKIKKMYCFGSTENFKSRFSQHKSSIKNRPALHTTLSSYIWKLKDKNVPYSLKWSIKDRGHVFSSGGRSCDLCLSEKLVIMMAEKSSMLNKRDELLESCRHRRKHLLVSLKEQLDTG